MMGIDNQTFNFLIYSSEKKQFGKTMSLGCQGIHLTEHELKEKLGSTSSIKSKDYCESLLINYFNAHIVNSIDNSGYEDATFVHDMNKQIPENLVSEYDTVFDGGCLEHIYNVPQALKNCSEMCKTGGQIIHALPTNNFNGHGFWQFSPELLFSLYSEKKGYKETEVFVADVQDKTALFKVLPPSNGKRVYVNSSSQTYVMVRTILASKDFSHDQIQQRDYIAGWGNTNLAKNQSNLMADALKQYKIIKKMKVVYKQWRWKYKHQLSTANKNLIRIRVNENCKSNLTSK
jgi:hypothetical protein